MRDKIQIQTLAQLTDKYIGEIGSPDREKFENELNDLRIGLKIREARLKLEMTQAELAEKVNKKRSFISRLENDGSNVTLKTLRQIVQSGFGGEIKIEVSI